MVFLRILFSIIFISLSFFYIKAFLYLFPNNFFNIQNTRMFLIGVGAGILFWAIFGKKLKFFAIFEHELTHMLVGILFLKKPRAISASENGGVTYISGNFLVSLAPYFFPTISFLILPLYFIIQVKYYEHFFLVLGLITGYHILSTIQETHPRQTDLLKNSLLFSYSFSIFGNIICLGFLFYFSVGGGKESILYIKTGFLALRSFILKIF